MELTSKAQRLYGVIRQIRSCFNRLRSLGDALHQDLGITASMRAVMESLAEDGEQTVPQIASAKFVSRQHIQVNVDMLLEEALVVLRDNPAHRRSPIVTLSKKGTSIFKEMRRRERAILENVAKEFDGNELEQSLKMLMKLSSTLVRVAKKGDQHD